MNKIKAAIIGTGTMGGIHGKLATESGRVEITGVFDTNMERAQGMADLYGAKAYNDMEELLKAQIDLVYITVPNNFHAPLTIKALEAGINVFCEKPLATKLSDVKLIKEAVKKSGKRLFVGHNRRFAPIYLAAKETVKEEDYKPFSLNIIQNDGDMGGSVWAADFINIGGFLYDTTIHFLDMAEYLMGEIEEVRALGKSACYEGIDDDFAIQLKFKNGGIGAITSCGHASWIFPFERVQVVGDHKSVITEELDVYKYCPGLSKTIDAKDYSKLPFEEKWGYVAMHQHMYDAMENNKEALNEGVVAGARSVALVEACYQSAANDGAAVTVIEG